MKLYGSSICFVNSHLAAGDKKVAERNQDYISICKKIVCRRSPPFFKRVENYDGIFWLGDLNYRLDLEMNRARELLDQGNLEELLCFDQLTAQRDARKIFIGYTEAPINFRPTYKYDPGTDDWDTSWKRRVPAWCDRILFKGSKIELLEYGSHPSLRISDHRPVSAVFNFGVKVTDNCLNHATRKVMQNLKQLPNPFRRHLSVDTTEIIMGEIHLDEVVTRVLTVTNTGRKRAQFNFSEMRQPWLTVRPCTGSLVPGEMAKVSLEVIVDGRTAESLNGGFDKLYDVLFLHVGGGKHQPFHYSVKKS